jgi:outer membrane lipoprotein-sorting protein
MKSAEDIKKYFEDAGLRTNPDTHERVFTDVLQAHQQAMAESPAQRRSWGFAVRHPAMRYALAAVVVLTAVVGFSLFRGTGNVSWAIEQSVRALDKYAAVLVEGLASERAWTEDGSLALQPVKIWAVASADQTAVEKYRFEQAGVTLLVTDGHKTWKYEPQAHRVTIKSRPYVASECWLGRGFLEQVKQGRDTGILTGWEETHGRDPATGRQRVWLRVAWLDRRWNGPRSIRLEFDLESKLLVRMMQWENARWEGPATFVAEKVTYCESLPDDLFQFQIPPGASVQEQ